MIIFDLDSTLADCEHRRHFVDRNHPVNEKRRLSEISLVSTPHPDPNPYIWKPDWQAFYEACDLDTPIESVITIFLALLSGECDVEIWSGRCESVRSKTEYWINNYVIPFEWNSNRLKMRPIGDNTPDDHLKERWLNEYLHGGQNNCPFRWATHDKCCKKIDFVFDSHHASIAMWRRRGIFVFDCNQTSEEF